jgi:RNA polymerase sigma factor (sigma-70 family)
MKIGQKLLNACSKGDRKAQEKLYKQCFQPLMGICMRYKVNESDGVALLNDAFLKILTHLPDLKPGVPFEAWAKRIVINCCINDYRKSKSRPQYIYIDQEAVLDHFDDHSSETNETVIGITLEKLRTCLDQLPESSSEVFQLYVLEGYSHKEIAQILSISEGTSKWHLNNARTKLKAMLHTYRENLRSIA